MSAIKNCPNCGAPYDNELTKCPYCGTSYFDMTSIDFDEGEPFYLRIKVNGISIVQFVRPVLGDVTVEHENIYTTDGRGTRLIAHSGGSKMMTNVSFEAIPDRRNKVLATVKKN